MRAVAILAVLLLASISMADTIIDSVNQNAGSDGNQFAIQEIGWFYKPTQDFNLTSVLTKFTTSTSNPRNVTEQLYLGDPNGGGVILTSATFMSDPGSWTGGSFSAVTLTAGTTYFIGFTNVFNSGSNTTADANATGLDGQGNKVATGFGVARFGDNGDTNYSSVDTGQSDGNPLLEFVGNTDIITNNGGTGGNPTNDAAPLPSSAIAIAALSLFAIIVHETRRRFQN